MTTTADLKGVAGLKQFRSEVNNEHKLESGSLYKTFEKIYTAMSDAHTVADGLRALNDRMWQELEGRMPPGLSSFAPEKELWKNSYDDYFNTNKQDFSIDARRKEKKSYKGVLTTVLQQTEKDNGFGKESYAWGTSAEAFLTNLRARRPFKDYSASVTDHGEYTHRIQWWIVCNRVLGNSTYNAYYYADCANWSCRLEDAANRKVYMWDFLFDSATNTTGESDTEALGRSPIYVFKQARKDEVPLLAAFLKYRVQKALTFGNEIMNSSLPKTTIERLSSDLAQRNVTPGILERAARRFRNTSFAALGSEEQVSLCTDLLEKGFTDDIGEA